MNKQLKLKYIVFLMLCGTLLFSCKDEQIQGVSGTAKVMVVNALVPSGIAKTQVGAKEISWSAVPDESGIGGSERVNKLFLVPADSPIIIKVVSVDDNSKVWYDEVRQLEAGKVYTLYIYGTVDNVETKFVEEKDWPTPTVLDALTPVPASAYILNIRFINLSPNGPKVDIKIRNAADWIVTGLKYGDFADFIAIPAGPTVEIMSFEVRDPAQNNKRLILYNVGVARERFKNITFLIKGVYDPDPLLKLDWFERYSGWTFAY